LSQEARTSDARLQKSQRLLIAAIRAVSRMTEKKENRQQAMNIMSLLLAFNFDYNMHRQDLLKPEMASEYQSVCSKNSAIPVTEFLFGDNIVTEFENISKNSRIMGKGLKRKRGGKFVPHKVARGGRGKAPRGRGFTSDYFKCQTRRSVPKNWTSSQTSAQ
jgi:hypothetical protein